MGSVVEAAVMERLRAFDDNLRWTKENAKQTSRFAGEYVVVAERKVVFHSKDKRAATHAASERPGSYLTLVAKPGLNWVL